MWHLADREDHVEPLPIQMELEQSIEDRNHQFLSFAKRSRVVQRLESECAPPLQQPTSLSQNRDNYWNRILCQSSEDSPEPTTSCDASQMQRFSYKPEGLVGVVMAETRPAGQRCKKGGKVCLEKLPSPADLMGCKKRGMTGRRSQGSQVVKPRVAAVLQHIGDLHRRQSSIDQLKRERWWSSTPRCKAEESNEQGPKDCGFSTTIVEGRDKTSVSFSPMPTPYNQEGLFGGFEQALHLAPGGNPMMSFVLATAERQAKGGWQSPHLSHKQFWGISPTTEE